MDCKAYIESVHSSPQMGVTSAFTFGRGFGWLEMALTAANVPFERITPQKWQKAMGCLTKGDKNVSKRKAQELFPDIKVTHAIADSLLIAEYGRMLGR
jgi:Holliday junction resolvasome RuvABC endonuclease subunit